MGSFRPFEELRESEGNTIPRSSDRERSVLEFATPHILHGLDKLGDQFVSRIESLRKHYREDSEFAKAGRKLPKGSPLLPATRLLLRELLGFFVKSTTKQLTRNDAADFFHAIVPLAHCDYVLLDGHWATQASIAAHRLYQAGQIETVAQAFSQRQNGLLKFFDTLESETV